MGEKVFAEWSQSSEKSPWAEDKMMVKMCVIFFKVLTMYSLQL